MQAVDELATRLFRAEAELQRVFETEVTPRPTYPHTPPNATHSPHALTHSLTHIPTHQLQTEHEGDLGQALKNALQVGLEPGISAVVKRVQQHLRQVIIRACIFLLPASLKICEHVSLAGKCKRRGLAP